LEADIAEVKEKTTTLETEVVEINDEITTVKQDVDAVEKSLETAVTNINTDINNKVEAINTNVATAQTAADNANANANSRAKTVTYTKAVDTTWTADSTNGGYKKTVAVSGMLATDNPIADIVLGADVDANALYTTAWAMVTRITTSANSITLYANGEKPTTAFNIQLKVVR
jgi:acetyl-CoA carboxylase alpha subunit